MFHVNVQHPQKPGVFGFLLDFVILPDGGNFFGIILLNKISKSASSLFQFDS